MDHLSLASSSHLNLSSESCPVSVLGTWKRRHKWNTSKAQCSVSNQVFSPLNMITLTICLVLETLILLCEFKARNSHLFRDLRCLSSHFRELKAFDSRCSHHFIVDNGSITWGKCWALKSDHCNSAIRRHCWMLGNQWKCYSMGRVL